MTKPLSGKPKTKHQVTLTSKGGGPPVATTSPSGTSLSQVSSQSAGTARVRSPITLRSSSSNTNDGDPQEPWMETATPGKFPEFQKKIFPVVEYLTSKREYAKHTFTKQWTALKRIPNNPMTADITWRNLKILLDIKDMSQYRDFLVQYPDFTKAVQLRNSKTTRSGFDFGIVPNPHLPTFTPLSLPNAKDEEETSYVFDVDISREDVEAKPPAVTNTVTSPTTDQAKHGTDIPIDITTPKKTNVTAIQDTNPADDTDGSLTSDGMADLLSSKDPTFIDDDALTGFNKVHFHLFEIVTTWTKQAGVENIYFTRNGRRQFMQVLIRNLSGHVLPRYLILHPYRIMLT
jgi:hypothetical protein